MQSRAVPLPLSTQRSRGIVPAFFRPKAIMRFLRDSRASRSSKLFFLLAAAYVLMPIDLVPDVAPILGWLDDAGFMTVAAAWGMNRISKYERENSEDLPTVVDVTPKE